MVKKIAAVFGSLIALAVGLASVPQSICACGNARMNFSAAVGANPMRDSASDVRTKFLQKLPVGSLQVDIDRLLKKINSSGDMRLANCQHADSARICRFPIRRSIWFEEGFELHFILDSDNRLADARVARFPAN